MDMARIGIFGKHPGYGDFVRAGLTEAVVKSLGDWLEAVLPDVRDQVGEHWPDYWDAAQDVRFWMGPSILNKTICGVLRPSRDKVGRRFPLVLAVEGVSMTAPLGETCDQTPWDGMVAHLDQMTPGQGGMALLEELSISFAAEDLETFDTGTSLWAHRSDRNLGALLRDAEEADAKRAQLARSYWWTTGTDDANGARAAAWLGCQGLPGPHALGWLLGGVAAEPKG